MGGGVQFGANDGGRARVHQHHGRGHGAQRHTGGGDCARGINRQADPGGGNGDVHLGPRDEAQIGVGAVRDGGGQEDRGDDLTLGQRGAAGGGGDRLDRGVAAAVRAFDADHGVGGKEGGHSIGSGGAVAQVAHHRAAALNLLGPDQLGGLGHAGEHGAERCMVAQLQTRHGGTDAETASLGRDGADTGDALDINDQGGFDHASLQLHHHISATSQNPGHAGFGAQQSCGLCGRLWLCILHAVSLPW